MTNSTQQSMFGYDASMPMAWVGGVAFSLVFVMQVFQYFHLHSFHFHLALLGIAMEFCGYWTRVVAIKEPNNGTAASMSYLLNTTAPSLIAAACYMTFGRIIFWVSPEEKRTLKYLWLPARWITTIFVSLDLASFLIACIGFFVLIANTSKKDLSPDQQLAGIAMTFSILRVAFVWQVIIFGLFSIFVLRFMFASKAWKYDWPSSGSSKWRRFAWVINVVAGLLLFRSLIRCLSFSLNNGDNYLKDHEWTFYLFDFVPILCCVILLSVFHPGRHMPREYMTIGHAYKQPGFRPDGMAAKQTEEQPAAGYSRVTLVPPPLAPPVTKISQAPEPSVSFSDPWGHRATPDTDRY